MKPFGGELAVGSGGLRAFGDLGTMGSEPKVSKEQVGRLEPGSMKEGELEG